jgi:ribosomal protein L3 glutamine methyltransferase
MITDRGALVRDLVTVRDWLRYAVGCFTRAALTYGHGTATALDEAAFLILEALRLPIDDINPWLDARLLEAERARIADLIEARVSRRVPAAYLVNAAYIQGRRFHVDERVIVPRSYIGELLLNDGFSTVVDGPETVSRVLDLCTGSGCLAILAAEVFPDARVDAVDLSADALAVAEKNVGQYGLEGRVQLFRGDLFEPIGEARYDLILANPPYVATAEVHAFTPEYCAEPTLAHHGGVDGLDLVRRILSGAREHLTPAGAIVVEVGTGRSALEHHLPDLPFLWLDSEDSEGEVLALPASALATTGQPRPRSKKSAGSRAGSR